MKLQLYGKNAQDIKLLVEEIGLEVVEENADVIVSYGGDGTLLASERQFPGIPKLPIRDSKVCKKCSAHETDHLIKLLKENQIPLTEQSKLEAEFEGSMLTALNDIVIRNKSAYHAIRFYIDLNNKRLTINDSETSPIIGDGIVASTPFGSTGYYQSITRKTFFENFQIVFNNTVEQLKPLEFKENDVITLTIVRGPGEMTADNNPETIELIESNIATIRVSSQKAKIYSPETLRCPKCEVRRDQRLHN